MSAPAAHPGRPRDHKLDDAILEAALDVFLEHGYLGASISEIARRAGLGTPAIYRRWPSKAAIAVAVMATESTPEPIPSTGAIRDDLIVFLRYRISVYRTPFFYQVVLPLFLEAAAQPAVRDEIKQGLREYRPPLLARIRDAVEAGELRSGIDPTRLLDLLMGTIAMPLLFSQPLPSESEAETIVDQVLEGFAPGPRNLIPD